MNVSRETERKEKMALATVGNVEWYETYYVRVFKNGNRRTKEYANSKTISVEGRKFVVHRAIGYAKATKYQRSRFKCYDCHHRDGNHQNNCWENIEVLTVNAHRKLHGK